MADIKNRKSFEIYFLFKGLKNAEKNELYTRFEDWYFNNFSGELLKKLRLEKSYVYTASFSNIKLINCNIKNFGILTSPENVNNCIMAMTEVLKNAIEKGVSEEEFAKFKQTIIAERERKTNIKHHYSDDLFNNYIYGEKPFVKNFYQKLLNLGRKEINDYMREIYGNGELIVDYVGDIAKAEQRFDYTKIPGWAVLSNEVFGKVMFEGLSREFPIYALEEVLSQFSIKYKDILNDFEDYGENFEDDYTKERCKDNGYIDFYVDYSNNIALNVRDLVNNKNYKSNKKVVNNIIKQNFKNKSIKYTFKI